MKKTLLLLAIATFSGASLHAQQRVALYEEFTGENCGPCVFYNPGLWALTGANPTKVLLVSYQTPIPSAGPIYNAYRTATDARSAYYNVNFAPQGRLDGTGFGTGNTAPDPGHIANLLQNDIDAETAAPAPFAIAVTHQWNPSGDSVTATIHLTAASAYAPTGANLKLRLALVEHLQYAVAPGTNGETEFLNVVREMYPNPGGTQLANAWTAGQSQTLTLKGSVPAYVNKAPAGEVRLIAWIQNDADHFIPQAAASTYVPLPVDVASVALNVPAPLVCANGNAAVNSFLTLRNAGSVPLSSATIYYRVDASAWQTYRWTGSLAAQATTQVALPLISVTPGNHILSDSVALPNGAPDVNGGNNAISTHITAYNSTGAVLPIASGFENGGTLPANWLLYDANANGKGWELIGSANSSIGHSGSTYSLWHNNAYFWHTPAEVNYAIMPTAILPSGPKTLEFYLAYAQQQLNGPPFIDTLKVVYSTDCGLSWTSLWERDGAALATAPITSNDFVPTQADWALQRVDVTAVPSNAMIAFRATSGRGNALYIDDVTLRSTSISAVTDVVTAAATSLAPNPSNAEATLSFDLRKSAAVRVNVVDALGRIIATPVNGSLSAGPQHVNIHTADLAAGLYNVVIHTAAGNLTKRLSVVH